MSFTIEKWRHLSRCFKEVPLQNSRNIVKAALSGLFQLRGSVALCVRITNFFYGITQALAFVDKRRNLNNH